MNRSTYIAFLILIPLALNAQTDTTSRQGEIVSGEIIIEKDKEIVLPPADKLFQKGTLLPLKDDPVLITLTAKKPDLTWPPYESDISFKKVKSTYPLDTYSSYIRLGYGNYGSPLAVVGIRKQVGSFALANKLSFERFSSGPVEGRNSGNAIGNMELAARYSTENFEVVPRIHFSRLSYRFYGNTDRLNPGFTTTELPVTNWSSLHFGVGIQGELKNFSYSLTPHASTSGQRQENAGSLNKESELGAEGTFQLRLNDELGVGMDVSGYSSKYTGGLAYDRTLGKATPMLKFKREVFSIGAGITAVSSRIDNSTETGIYPRLEGRYQMSPNWSILAHIKGGREWMSLGTLISENEFIDDSLQLLNLEERINVGGELVGRLTNKLSLQVGISYANLSDMPFFLPSASDSSKYSVGYDQGGVQRLRIATSLEYVSSPYAFYTASFQLNSYTLRDFERPWHLPLYTFKLHARHSIREKVVIASSLLVLGGISAPTNVDFGIEELKPIFDASLSIDYRINERLSAFLSTQNLFNRSYERYLGYPIRGMTFKIGGQYRF